MSKKEIISKVKFRLLEKYTAKNLQPLEGIINDCIDNTLKAIDYNRCSVQLLCVEKGDDNGITRGYEYKCINQDKDHYKIIDNYGYENWFLKEYFTKI